MIKDITNSIRSTLYQRVSSPLFGTYLASWLLYNWKEVLSFLFGSPDFEKRLQTFHNSFYNNDGGLQENTLLIPLLMTCLALFITPLIQRYFYIYNEWNKSEGLKKRDKFTSETMLTLEQSNELRDSIQKVQKFHQETIENKNQEIEEYKNQLESKKNILNSERERLNEYLNSISKLESDNSKISADLAEHKSKIEELNQKYVRLSRILKKQRKRTYRRLSQMSSPQWYATSSLIDGLSRIVNIEDSFDKETYGSLFRKLLSVSEDPKWKYSCHRLMVDRFFDSWSYDMADNFFRLIIEPHLNEFEDDNISHLKFIWDLNSQIRDRGRASADYQKVLTASKHS